MSDLAPRPERSLSDVEVAEFRALGLTPGHWSALAPIPLFLRDDLRRAEFADYELLHALGEFLPSEGEFGSEADEFWTRSAASRVPTGAIDLLGWHLAHHVTRDQRERYLGALDRAAVRFSTAGAAPPTHLPDVSRSVREVLETALGHQAFARHLPRVKVEPPDPAEVGRWLGPDLWKQMLAAAMAAVLTEQNASDWDSWGVVRDLARLPERPTAAPADPLREHLRPSWLVLFDRLLGRRSATAPPIELGLGIAAWGLASMNFAERYRLLDAIGEWIRKSINRDDSEVVASGWVDRLRALMEDALQEAAAPAPSPSPGRETAIPSIADATPATVEDSFPLAAPSAPVPQLVTPMKPISPPPPATPRSLVAVETVSDFETVTHAEALAWAADVTVVEIREWLARSENAACFLFDDQRTECPEVAIVRDPAVVPNALWVIGDLHADVLTLANIIAHAEKVAEEEGEPPAFLFLGDFVDRGRHDHETLLLLFRLIMKNPGRVCVVPGNHDIDLRWGEKDRKFGVSIEPAEYCERLNGLLDSDDPAARDQLELAKLSIEFWKTRPLAVILPDGTMFSHGGFPHTDLQKTERDDRRGIPERVLLRDVKQLGEPAAVSDFLWARLSESPKKRPNRSNRGHEFGWKDFAQFCRIMIDVVRVPVKRLIRGHDHVAARWHLPADYTEYPVLTINAMGRRLDGEPESSDGPHPLPVMARHVVGELPRIVRLPLDVTEVNRAFGNEKPDTGGGTTSRVTAPRRAGPSDESFDPDDFPSAPQVDPLPPRAPRATDSERGGGV